MAVIIITGTPGTGKSSVAEALQKMLGKKWLLVNEKEFCKKQGIGKIDKKSGELEVPLKALQKRLSAFIKERQKKGFSLILEGHLLCEIKLPADLVVLLKCEPKLLEKRLLERKYSQLKALDNVFCEMIGYCGKKVLENFPKTRLLELENGKSIKEIAERILKAVENF